MTRRKPVTEMTGHEIGGILRTYTPEQIIQALIYLSGYEPEAFEILLGRLERGERPRLRENGAQE